jgi:hypothetical protein
VKAESRRVEASAFYKSTTHKRKPKFSTVRSTVGQNDPAGEKWQNVISANNSFSSGSEWDINETMKFRCVEDGAKIQFELLREMHPNRVMVRNSGARQPMVFHIVRLV